jgi:uncharacterized phage-like protein YoqJ
MAASTRRGSPSRGLIWAATGHRPNRLGGYGDEVYERLVAEATKFLIEFEPRRMIVGMALGWDTAMAEACARCNVPFIAAIPFEGQEKVWSENDRARYFVLLAASERVEIISRNGYSPAVMHLRNHWMVDNAEAIVALYDRSDRGGTFNCIRYAERLGKPIVNLWDQFHK